MLRSDSQRTDVSGQPIGPILQGYAARGLTLEDGTDKLYWNVGNLTTNVRWKNFS